MKRSTTKQPSIIKKLFATTLPILFWIGLWWLSSILLNKEVVLPSPVVVAERLAANIITAEFWIVTFISLFRIAAGFLLALALGLLISFAAFFNNAVNRLFSPLISVLRAMPVASYIILLYMMLSNSIIPVVTAFLIVLPVVWENTITGLKSADEKLLEVCKTYGINGLKRLKIYYFPSLKPYFHATILASMGMAWKAGVAAEVLTTPKFSIGKELNNAKVYLDSADLFAWTAVVILLSFLIEYFIKRGLKYNGYGKKHL